MGLFPLEDVRTMVFELSLIRSAFIAGATYNMKSSDSNTYEIVRQ